LSNPKWPRLRPDKSSGDQSPFHSSHTKAKSSWNQWEVSHSIKCHVAIGNQQETNQKKSKTSYWKHNMQICKQSEAEYVFSDSNANRTLNKFVSKFRNQRNNDKKQRTWTSSENPLADEQNAVAKQTSNSMLLANLHNFAKPVPFLPVKFFKAQAASIMVVDFVNCVL
jgi:hypothetical protein